MDNSTIIAAVSEYSSLKIRHAGYDRLSNKTALSAPVTVSSIPALERLAGDDAFMHICYF